MKVTFAMPPRSPVPIGGILAAYRIADELARRGHEVTIVLPRTVGRPRSTAALVAHAWVWRYRREPARLAPFYDFKGPVRLLPVVSLDPSAFPNGDALVATPTFDTADAVVRAPAEKGEPLYFIQGDDAWFAPVETVRAAWRLPLRKIVISRWLYDGLAAEGEASRTTVVPIGLDQGEWGVDEPPAERPPRVGALLSPTKGADDILAAMSAARGQVPDLCASFYGVGEAPPALPDWAEYVRLPSRAALRRLYNRCSVFAQASRAEGWGLPACEAMACGCALVTYDNGGSREYAIDGQTARVVDGFGADPLAAAVIEILRDDRLRERLATAGRRLVSQFTWERSAAAFEAALGPKGP